MEKNIFLFFKYILVSLTSTVARPAYIKSFFLFSLSLLGTFSSREGVLPKILGGGLPHGSQNPDPISHQNILFSLPLFRPDPENLK